MKYLPIIGLLIANLIPAFGILYLDWSLLAVIYGFWLENIIVGFFTVLKMVRASGGNLGDRPKNILFFICLFGVFTLGHGSFLRPTLIFFTGSYSGIMITFISLTVSHYLSYMVNYLGKGEYLTRTSANFIFQPFPRVIAMQIFILGGAALLFYSLLKMNQIILLPTILIISGKILIDLIGHLREHNYYAI